MTKRTGFLQLKEILVLTTQEESDLVAFLSVL